MPLLTERAHVRAYLGDHFGYLALIALLFSMGIIFGALTVNNLAQSERQSLLNYLRVFFHNVNGSVPLQGSILAKEAIWTNLKTLLFLFMLGITAIGAPLILLVVFTRGFVLGFTVGLLVKELAAKGFFFALAAVLPHNLLLVPALLIASVANLDFGIVLIKQRLGHKTVQLSREFIHCLVITGAAALAVILAGLIEGYFSPVLMAWMAKYLS